MFKFEPSTKEASERVWAQVNEVFDEEDRIDEEAAEFFGVTVDFVRHGKTGRPDPEIADWVKQRLTEAGWEYRF